MTGNKEIITVGLIRASQVFLRGVQGGAPLKMVLPPEADLDHW